MRSFHSIVTPIRKLTCADHALRLLGYIRFGYYSPNVCMEVGMTLSRWTFFPAYSLALAVALAGPAGLRFPEPAFAQSYPHHAVTIVVPFPAGGPLDFTARLLAEKLSASLKQTFIVENRPGVAGNMGTEAVARATPDGHTLLMVLDTAPNRASSALPETAV
jgi:hypothetical protein